MPNRDARKEWNLDLAGIALLNFLKGIETADTFVGDKKSASRSFSDSMMVLGIELEPASYSSVILGKEVEISKERAFNNVLEHTPEEILERCKKNASEELYEQARIKLEKFQEHRAIGIMLKPGSKCDVLTKDRKDESKKKEKWYTHTNKFLKYSYDSKTEQFKGKFIVESRLAEIYTANRITIPLSDYGKSIFVLNSNPNLDSMKERLICLTDHGYIRPIQVEDEEVKLVLDSTFLYEIDEEGISIVTSVMKKFSDDITDERIKESKAYKLLVDNMVCINKHKKNIAPYGFIEENSIKI